MSIATLTARPLMPLPEEGRAPTAFRVLRAGLNRTEKGEFIFDAEAAKAVMAAYAAKGLDKIQIDFEHQSLQPPPAGGDAAKPAAGWFRPEVRDGELWATAVAWTARALNMLAPEVGAPEYRYFSPILFFDESTRRVTALKNLALTNDPAMDVLAPLAAASCLTPTRERTISMSNISIGLTAEDRRVAQMLGNDPRAVDDFKRHQAEEQQLEETGSTMVALTSGASELVTLTAEDRRVARMLGNSLRDVARFKAEQVERVRRGW